MMFGLQEIPARAEVASSATLPFKSLNLIICHTWDDIPVQFFSESYVRARMYCSSQFLIHLTDLLENWLLSLCVQLFWGLL